MMARGKSQSTADQTLTRQRSTNEPEDYNSSPLTRFMRRMRTEHLGTSGSREFLSDEERLFLESDEYMLWDQPWRHRDSKRGFYRHLPLIHPDATHRIMWQICMAFPLLYMGTVLPWRITFLDFRIHLTDIGDEYEASMQGGLQIPVEVADSYWVAVDWVGCCCVEKYSPSPVVFWAMCPLLAGISFERF